MTMEIHEGTRVCIYGWGTAIGIHKHVAVDRVTKTMVVTSDGRRFNRRTGWSVPRGGFGGMTIAATCQDRRYSSGPSSPMTDLVPLAPDSDGTPRPLGSEWNASCTCECHGCCVPYDASCEDCEESHEDAGD